VLATGSRPIQPPIPGLELKNAWYVRHPDDAESMVDEIESMGLRDAVLIGAGYIGVEMAEALRRRGLNVTMVEIFDQIMPRLLDPEMVMLAGKHLRKKDIELALSQQGRPAT
jgi:NADPH-dependent 2,4-dienoyl-CoA reductase/sulfur reductase-like enzyme